MITLYNNDCLNILKTMKDNSIDSVITDPPYGLSQIPLTKFTNILEKWLTGERDYIPTGKGFMNLAWDSFVPPPALWDEVYRVLKPGGHLLCFSGSRTHDLMNISLRLANFEIRDTLQWIYSSGLPKSLNAAKAVEAETLYGSSHTVFLRKLEQEGGGEAYTINGTNNGILGTKRTYERKTYKPSTDIGEKWDGWGTSLKPSYEPITLARKPMSEASLAKNIIKHSTGALNIDDTRFGPDKKWPTNILFDEEQAKKLDEQLANASRFFYVSKPSKKEKPVIDGISHETVKPLDLMIQLVSLITPENGTILDPFAGSGTTLEAAWKQGYTSIGIEQESRYIKLIEQRFNNAGLTTENYHIISQK